MKKKLLTFLLLLSSTTYIYCCDPAFRTYFVKENKVYFGYYGADDLKDIHVDISSFKQLDSPLYAVDKNNVFYIGEKLSGANPSTFQFLGGVNTIAETEGYSKDDKNVFYDNKNIKIADVNTFEVIAPSYNTASVYQDGYAKDKNRIFRFGEIMNQYDASTFKVLGWFYTADKSGVYYNDKLISDSTGKEYKQTNGYMVIGNNVYLNGNLKTIYDATTFDVVLFDIQPQTSCGGYGLECFVTKDKNGIYLNDKKQYSIDLSTFKDIDRFNFKDKSCIYTLTPPTYDQEASMTRKYLAKKKHTSLRKNYFLSH